MTPGALQWEFKNQHLYLLPQKAIFWEEESALIVTDVHLGKVGHFRKAGIAIPKGMEQADLSSLTDLLVAYKAKTVIFIGDLFHSDMNNDWGWLLLWRDLFKSVRMILIRGNHDILHNDHYLEARFELHTQLCIGPFNFMHEPAKKSCEGYPVSGHIHPGVRLFGKGRQSVVLPCFFFGETQAILPAFGRFTGNVALKHSERDRVFGILEKRVIAF